MDVYVEAWRTFRSLSNENEVTAAHLISRPGWPKRPGSVLVDIGCGDGRLLGEVLKRSEGRIATVWLIDPDAAFLTEAQTTLAQDNPAVKVHSLLGSGEDQLTAVTDRFDVCLAVHVVYLMKEGALETVLHLLPPGMPLYLILDERGSIFSTLWQQTRPEYHERVQAAYRTIVALPADRFHVERTLISSELRDPETIADEHLRLAVVSLLCYRNMIENEDPDLLNWVLSELRKKCRDGFVLCESACYEIVRR